MEFRKGNWATVRVLLLVLRLMAAGAAPGGTSWVAGAVPADFTVEAPVTGRTFRLSEAKGRYVALHFLLKTECPYCLRHTREYAMRSAASTNVVHLFLKPDGVEEIKAWTEQSKRGGESPAVTVYRDPDAKLAEQFGIPGGYAFHGETVHYPALVLLDPDGAEIFRYVGKSNADRLGYEAFAKTLSEFQAKSSSALTHYHLGADRLALKGYDPVGYLVQNKAIPGRKEIRQSHLGVTYYFASEENRGLFRASPGRYLPAYGGWCATAMAKGEKVEIDPTNFKVTNGRLVLFFKAFYANALKDWNKDEVGLTAKADAQWKIVSGE